MKRSRRGEFIAASVVIVAPFLLAFFLTGGETPAQVPQVTRVLEGLAAAPPSDPAVGSDSPVASAKRGGTKLAIDFKRGSRVSLGKMHIPAIGLKTRFYDGVVDEAVKRGPGHWPGTPWPGERGNSVFAGHRTTYTHPFADLDLLGRGDKIRVQLRNSRWTTYRYFRTMVVSEAEYARVVLKQPVRKSVRMITLFACTPKGSRSHRIIVQAKALPKKDASNGKRGGEAMTSS